MNCERNKPFVCKTAGCDLKFTNQDHLIVHEKKHGMVLSLDNKVFLDQTPTPTTLIKNCEEVGLFEDLRNVNPFDETFRRAVEIKNINSLEENTVVKNVDHLINEDTLHTPQVFPNSLDEETNENNNNNSFRVEKQKVILTGNLDNKRKTPVKQLEESINKPTKRQKSLTELVLKSNATKSSSSSPKIRSTRERIIIPAPSNRISVIQPHNIAWHSSQTLILPKYLNTLTKNDNKSTISIKDKIKAIITNNEEIRNSKENQTKCNSEKCLKTKKEINNNDDGNMERKRAAAVRYRKKKHLEQCDLRKRNAELLSENLELKLTIRQLQDVLQAHQNCEITKSTLKTSPNGKTAQLLSKSNPTILIPASTIVMNIPKLIIKNAGHHVYRSTEI